MVVVVGGGGRGGVMGGGLKAPLDHTGIQAHRRLATALKEPAAARQRRLQPPWRLPAWPSGRYDSAYSDVLELSMGSNIPYVWACTI